MEKDKKSTKVNPKVTSAFYVTKVSMRDGDAFTSKMCVEIGTK